MNALTYRVLQTFSVVTLILAELTLSWILIWLIEGHGVIACGKGIFDSPRWPLDVMLFVGVPILFIVAAGSLFLWCSTRISRMIRRSPAE